MPSTSVEAEPSKVTVKGAVPVKDMALMTAVGALFVFAATAVTTTGVLVEPVNPLLSVTVRVVVEDPTEVKVWVVFAPVAKAPSPKFQA